MVASLSISGIPPFNGFFSKLIIIIAAIQAGHPVFAFWAILGSLLTLASFMKVQRYGFYGEVEHKKIPFKPGKLIRFAMVTLAVFCLLSSFLVLPGLRELTLDPVVKTIMDKTEYIQLVIGRAQ